MFRKTLIISILLLTITQPVQVYASLSNQQKQVLNNGLGLLDTEVSCDTASSSADPATTVSPNDRLQFIYTHMRGRGLSPVAAAAIAGNITQESGGDPTIVERNSNHKELPKNTNDPESLPEVDGWPGSGRTRQPGWGIIQWTPARKVVGLAKEANVTTPIYTLGAQLDLLYWHMNVKDPSGSNMTKKDGLNKTWFEKFNAYTDVEAAVIEFERQIERAALPNNANRVAAAKVAIEKYESAANTTFLTSTQAQNAAAQSTDPAALAATGLADAGCSPATAFSATNIPTTPAEKQAAIQATVLKYAWPDYHEKPYRTAKFEYNAAVLRAIDEKRYRGGINYPGIDCGGFVTIALHDSGVAPDYNTMQWDTENLYNNFATNPSKYGVARIANPTVDNLLPGDIALKNGHTYLYVGKIPGFNSITASASLDQRAPMAGYEKAGDRSYTWYRYVGKGNDVSL